jgi:nitrate/nitrite transporter NarK
MRWLAVWLVLTGVYLVGLLALSLLVQGDWRLTRDDLAHLAAVPAAQVAALRIVSYVRRQGRR